MAAKKKEFLIVNRRTGKALQATGLDNGRPVQQAEITKSDAQIWTSEKFQNGVKIINKGAAKALDLMTSGVESGTWAQTWESVNGESQVWKITGTTYKKITNLAAGKVLDIAEMSEEDGAPAQIWDDIGGENQRWQLVEIDPKNTPAKPTAGKKTANTTAEKKPVKKAAAKAPAKTAVKKSARADVRKEKESAKVIVTETAAKEKKITRAKTTKKS